MQRLAHVKGTTEALCNALKNWHPELEMYPNASKLCELERAGERPTVGLHPFQPVFVHSGGTT